jgi:capsular exopolysaccharide synthesis family protein
MTALAEQLVSLVAPASVEADQYRGLRHTVEQMHRDVGLQVLAVTSPGAGEGKTITTLNLAGSLAQAPRARVLVIDADLHRPSVGEYLGIDRPHSPGLAEAIVNEDDALSRSIRRIDSLNLSVLLAGDCQSGAYELLNAPRLEALLKDARGHFDYVLIDTPPVVPLPDCRLLGQWVDGFLVVVAAHKTPRRALAEALNLLDSAKVIGTVFNGDDRPLAPYSAYYGHYGYRDDPSRQAGGQPHWWRRSRKTQGGTSASGN